MSRGPGVLQRRALEALRAEQYGLPLVILRDLFGADERNLRRALDALVARGLAETWLNPEYAPVCREWAPDYLAREAVLASSMRNGWPSGADATRALSNGPTWGYCARVVRCYRAK
jgi:hypothetical protein